MKMPMDLLGKAAGLTLLIFCGAGVYWNFLWWFHDDMFADASSVILPVLLVWLTLKWIDQQP
jgi:hypothetical protein